MLQGAHYLNGNLVFTEEEINAMLDDSTDGQHNRYCIITSFHVMTHLSMMPFKKNTKLLSVERMMELLYVRCATVCHTCVRGFSVLARLIVLHKIHRCVV